MHSSCLICRSDRIEKMKGYERHYLVRCRQCGFVFCRVIPSEAELINHYRGYGRNDYLSPVTVKRYNELLDLFESKLRSNGIADKIKVLDWGAGIGYFLEEAMKRGWQSFGTEYTERAVEICREKGIEMYQGSLSAVALEDESLDLITSFEVIEHINNPREEVERIWRLLKPGGLFYCTTPNFNSLLRYYLKDQYNVITYPEHLSYYTPSTMHRLLREQGFQRIFTKSSGLSVTRFRKSKKISNEALISPVSSDEKLRVLAEEKKYMNVLKATVNGLLNVIGTGDTIKALYVKPKG